MIQRVQSLYLIAIVILHIALFFLPVFVAGTLPDANPAGYVYLGVGKMSFSTGLNNMTDIQDGIGILLIALNVLIALLALVDIFLFRNRPLQLRVSRFVALVVIIFIAALFYASQHTKDIFVGRMGNVPFESAYKIGIWLPILSLILAILAGRGIMKDERLVRSADRIR